MPRQNVPILAFNRGIVSNLVLGRVDLDRLAWAAEDQTNWIPRSLGSMMLRPGSSYLGSTDSNNKARFLPFIYSTDTKALLEITNNLLRVWVDDAVISRTAITGTITNGTFTSDVASWTDADESGSTSAWKTGGYLSLIGTGFNQAIRRQTFSVTDTGVAHPIRIIIQQGPVTLKLGSTSGGSEYLNTSLDTGTHSIEVTPTTSSLYIEFSSALKREVLVDSIAFESTGILTLPMPYAMADIPNIRYWQSADVVFLACKDIKPKKIERRSQRSWSIVDFESNDGPFGLVNVGPVKLTASALSGDITVTADKPFFKSTHVGALFKVDSTGQTVTQSITAEDQFSGSIKITGVGSSRGFAVTVSAGFTATVTLQRSIGAPGSWEDVESYAIGTSKTFSDGLDNQEIYYRIGVKTGDYTSGTITATLSFGGGTISGTFKVTAFSSSTSVSAGVIVDLGSTDAESDWYEGQWSDLRGYPTAVSLYEGRLWWAGKTNIWASVSDLYYSYDTDVVGDSSSINRSIGYGPVDDIHWLLPLTKLLVGTAGAEISVRSSSFDEVVTPSTFNFKNASTQGSAYIDAKIIDTRGIYIHRTGTRLMELAASDKSYGYYESIDLTLLAPEIARAGITRIAIQRMPDTRVHCVLADGSTLIYATDPAEGLKAWVRYETDGTVEDVTILPGLEEDEVYYCINRTGGRYLEKWALETECRGETVNGFAQSKCLDSHITYSGAAVTTITGLGHLEGKTVGVWGNGKDLGSYVVSSSQITGLPEAVTLAYIGLLYTADYKSSKLAYAAGMGTALTQKKQVTHLGLILADTHAQGLQYGPDADNLDNLPLIEEGATVDPDYIWSSYDFDSVEFDGEWDTDSRMYLRAQAPRPCTVVAAVPTIVTHDKS